jgi:hypothetical protein
VSCADDLQPKYPTSHFRTVHPLILLFRHVSIFPGETTALSVSRKTRK